MKFREIEAFDAFMKHGTTQAAAETLAISQSMVSRLLSGLEEDLGFTLFKRKKNQLAPTEEAFIYHASVQRLMASIRDTQKDAEAISNNQLGNVVVAAQPIFCDTFLLDVIKRFKERHPNVGVRVIDAGLQELLKMIDNNTCDLALGITLEADTYGASVTRLGRCAARCIMHRDHPLARETEVPIASLQNQTFVELMADSPLRARVDYIMQTIDIKRNITAELRNMRGVCALVDRGLGIAVIDPIAELLLQGTAVVSKPLDPTIEWEIALLTSKNRPLSNVANAFSNEIHREIDNLRQLGILNAL
ncbi:LysR family transcriptional regulator [Aidingimonas halophila]|uniref:DNA-binding transcriptional regulator, LysR family n=1 Tax=Aidingimonas halophila TaxID=574349 RepID=A0A1H3CVP0_9GAMM|nr:LysR family transcriptional regulator [Aidingimonas halophila]GHC30980.1 LysR family transcriptional regulator [Aidingimonas halophila]SDX58146.1 DNA-binding transcriptional regulator, LysR family [Aidingimonas halophila]